MRTPALTLTLVLTQASLANVDIFDDEQRQIAVALVTYMRLGPMTREQVDRRKTQPDVFGEGWAEDDSIGGPDAEQA